MGQMCVVRWMDGQVHGACVRGRRTGVRCACVRACVHEQCFTWAQHASIRKIGRDHSTIGQLVCHTHTCKRKGSFNYPKGAALKAVGRTILRPSISSSNPLPCFFFSPLFPTRSLETNRHFALPLFDIISQRALIRTSRTRTGHIMNLAMCTREKPTIPCTRKHLHASAHARTHARNIHNRCTNTSQAKQQGQRKIDI